MTVDYPHTFMIIVHGQKLFSHVTKSGYSVDLVKTNTDEFSIKFIQKDWNISLHVNEQMRNAKN